MDVPAHDPVGIRLRGTDGGPVRLPDRGAHHWLTRVADARRTPTALVAGGPDIPGGDGVQRGSLLLRVAGGGVVGGLDRRRTARNRTRSSRSGVGRVGDRRTPRIACGGVGARAVVWKSLDDGLGEHWREETRRSWLDRIRTRPPLGRILSMPFVLRPWGVRRVGNVSYGDAGRFNLLNVPPPFTDRHSTRAHLLPRRRLLPGATEHRLPGASVPSRLRGVGDGQRQLPAQATGRILRPCGRRQEGDRLGPTARTRLRSRSIDRGAVRWVGRRHAGLRGGADPQRPLLSARVRTSRHVGECRGESVRLVRRVLRGGGPTGPMGALVTGRSTLHRSSSHTVPRTHSLRSTARHSHITCAPSRPNPVAFAGLPHGHHTLTCSTRFASQRWSIVARQLYGTT